MSENTSPNFTFEYPIQHDPSLGELKRIADITFHSVTDELGKAMRIINYAHSLFTHDGDNTPSLADPLTILKEAKAGQAFRCVEYSTLATGLLWAYDVPARTIGLKTSDVETRKYGAGHVVIEFWSKDYGKWVMSDVQFGFVPKNKNVPLSAYELKQNLQSSSVQYAPIADSTLASDIPFDRKLSYPDWIQEYLYFLDTPLSLTLDNEDKSKQRIVMLVPAGVQPPKMFQGLFEMNALHISKPQDFYTSPITS